MTRSNRQIERLCRNFYFLPSYANAWNAISVMCAILFRSPGENCLFIEIYFDCEINEPLALLKETEE